MAPFVRYQRHGISGMTQSNRQLRVLQSFPHKIGGPRICTTAWHQAAGAARAGGNVLAMPGAVAAPLPTGIRVRPTLARGKWFLPYRVVGEQRAFQLHDQLVARALPRLAGQVDVVHTWPLGARRTLEVARGLGIPTVLERPNAHTRFAYETVGRECARLGVVLPPDSEHAYKHDVLRREEIEYALADRLLCPSEFVAETFVTEGFPREKLARHSTASTNGFSTPSSERRDRRDGLTLLFVGVCAVRKGLHFALEAWHRSPASQTGKFQIAGEFLPAYADRLADLLDHPSIAGPGAPRPTSRTCCVRRRLRAAEPRGGLSARVPGGHRQRLRAARVRTACSEACVHGESGLVHAVGDVDALAEHITALAADRALLERMRAACLESATDFTWTKAGDRLMDAYREVVAGGPGPSA